MALLKSFFLTSIWLPHVQLWAIIEGGSLTQPMLITAFLQVRPEGHGELNKIWSIIVELLDVTLVGSFINIILTQKMYKIHGSF